MEKAKAYIKSSLGPKPASPSGARERPATADELRVCFVCGVAGFSEQYTIRIKPDQQVLIPDLMLLEIMSSSLDT